MDSDGPVDDKEEGREIRQEQMEADLKQGLQLQDLDIAFFDAHTDTPTPILAHLVKSVEGLRQAHYDRLDEIESYIKDLSENLNIKQLEEANKKVSDTLKPWLTKALAKSPEVRDYFFPLVRAITATSTYAASVRASVNRNGRWYNLDFYQALSSSSRAEAVKSLDELNKELLTLVNNMLEQESMKPAYPLIKQIKRLTEKRSEAIYQQAFDKGLALYESDLKTDRTFWMNQYHEWGRGSGYKDRIAKGTKEWFQNHNPNLVNMQVSKTINKSWKRYLAELQGIVGELAS